MLQNFLAVSGITLSGIRGNDEYAPYPYWEEYSYYQLSESEISGLTNKDLDTTIVTLASGQYTCIQVNSDTPIYAGLLRFYFGGQHQPAEVGITVPGDSHEYDSTIVRLDSDSIISREDYKGDIVFWNQVSGTKGYFEEAIQYLSASSDVELYSADYFSVFTASGNTAVTGKENYSYRQIFPITSDRPESSFVVVSLTSPSGLTTSIDNISIAPADAYTSEITTSSGRTQDHNVTDEITYWHNDYGSLSDQGRRGHFEGRAIELNAGFPVVGHWNQYVSWSGTESYTLVSGYENYSIRQIVPGSFLDYGGDGLRITFTNTTSSGLVVNNASVALANSTSIDLVFNDNATATIADVKGEIVTWRNESTILNWRTKTYSPGYEGHFEGAEIQIDIGSSAIQYSPNIIGIPAAGHGLAHGTYIHIRGTTYYNGYYYVLTFSTSDIIVIEAVYDPETFSSASKCAKVVTLGHYLDEYGNYADSPDVVPYTYVTFSGGLSAYILDIENFGLDPTSVELSEKISDGTIVATITDVNVDSEGWLSPTPGLDVSPDYQSNMPVVRYGGTAYTRGNSPLIRFDNRYRFDENLFEEPDKGFSIQEGSLFKGTVSCVHESEDPFYEGDWTGWRGVSYLFDRAKSQPWSIETRDCPNIMCYQGTDPVTFEIDFVDAKLFNKYQLWIQTYFCREHATEPAYPRSWRLEGSNDRVNWFTLDSETDFSIIEYEVEDVPPDEGIPNTCAKSGWKQARNTNFYRYYRFYFYNRWTTIRGRDFYGPSGPVQTMHLDDIDFIEHIPAAGMIPTVVSNTEWIDKLEGIYPNETLLHGSKIYYALSFDEGSTFRIHKGGGWKDIVTVESGVWSYLDQYNSWNNASSQYQAFKEAFLLPSNKMDSNELANIPVATMVNTLPSGGYVHFGIGFMSPGIVEPILKSITISGTIYNDTAITPPTEVTISGNSGFTIPAYSSVTSDWINQYSDGASDLLIITDVESDVIPVASYDTRYFTKDLPTYDLSEVDNSTLQTGVALTSTIETRFMDSISITSSGHELEVGELIRVSGTGIYDKTYTIKYVTDPDEFHVFDYHTELDMPADSYVYQRLPIGLGHHQADTQVGSVVEFSDTGSYYSVEIEETVPSGVYFVTSNYARAGTGYEAHRIMDKHSYTEFHYNFPVSSGEALIGLYFPDKAKQFDSFRLCASESEDYWKKEFPKDIMFEASSMEDPELNNDSHWQTLFSGTYGLPIGPGRYSDVQAVTITGTYNNYRIKLLSNYGTAYDGIRIAKLDLYEAGELYTGWTMYAPAVGYDSGYAFDQSPYTQFSSQYPLTSGNVCVAIDFLDQPKQINKLRIRAARDPINQNIAWGHSFPNTIVFYGSNLSSPALTSDSDWIDLSGSITYKELYGPTGLSQWGSWLEVSGSSYRHYRLKVINTDFTTTNQLVEFSGIDFEFYDDYWDAIDGHFVTSDTGSYTNEEDIKKVWDSEETTEYSSLVEPDDSLPFLIMARFDEATPLKAVRFRSIDDSEWEDYCAKGLALYATNEQLEQQDEEIVSGFDELYYDQYYKKPLQNDWGPWVYFDFYTDSYRLYKIAVTDVWEVRKPFRFSEIGLLIDESKVILNNVTDKLAAVDYIEDYGNLDSETRLNFNMGTRRSVSSIRNTFTNFSHNELSPGTYFFRGETNKNAYVTVPEAIYKTTSSGNIPIEFIPPGLADMNIMAWHPLNESSGDYTDLTGKGVTAKRIGTIGQKDGVDGNAAWHEVPDDITEQRHARFTLPSRLQAYTVAFWFKPDHLHYSTYDVEMDIMGGMLSYGDFPGVWHISMNHVFVHISSAYPFLKTTKLFSDYYGRMVFGNPGGAVMTGRNYWSNKTWYHVAFAFFPDASASNPYKVWINGVPDEAVWYTHYNPIVYPPQDVIIPDSNDIHYDTLDKDNTMYFGLPFDPLDGEGTKGDFSLQHVMHFNKVLSDSEIFDLYRFHKTNTDDWDAINFADKEEIEIPGKIIIDCGEPKSINKYSIIPATTTDYFIPEIEWNLTASGEDGWVNLEDKKFLSSDQDTVLEQSFVVNATDTFPKKLMDLSSNMVVKEVSLDILTTFSGGYSEQWAPLIHATAGAGTERTSVRLHTGPLESNSYIVQVGDGIPRDSIHDFTIVKKHNYGLYDIRKICSVYRGTADDVRWFWVPSGIKVPSIGDYYIGFHSLEGTGTSYQEGRWVYKSGNHTSEDLVSDWSNGGDMVQISARYAVKYSVGFDSDEEFFLPDFQPILEKENQTISKVFGPYPGNEIYVYQDATDPDLEGAFKVTIKYTIRSGDLLTETNNLTNTDVYQYYAVDIRTPDESPASLLVHGLYLYDSDLISTVSGSYTTVTSGIIDPGEYILSLYSSENKTTNCGISYAVSRDAMDSWWIWKNNNWFKIAEWDSTVSSGIYHDDGWVSYSGELNSFLAAASTPSGNQMDVTTLSGIDNCGWDSLGQGPVLFANTFINNASTSYPSVNSYNPTRTTWDASESPKDITFSGSSSVVFTGNMVSDPIEFDPEQNEYAMLITDISSSNGNLLENFIGYGYLYKANANSYDQASVSGYEYVCSGSYLVSDLSFRHNDKVKLPADSITNVAAGDYITISGTTHYNEQQLVYGTELNNIILDATFYSETLSSGSFYRRVHPISDNLIGSQIYNPYGDNFFETFDNGYAALMHEWSDSEVEHVYPIVLVSGMGLRPALKSTVLRPYADFSFKAKNIIMTDLYIPSPYKAYVATGDPFVYRVTDGSLRYAPELDRVVFDLVSTENVSGYRWFYGDLTSVDTFPTSWSLSASNDMETWITLDTISGVESVSSWEWSDTYTFVNEEEYRYYAFVFDTDVKLRELQLLQASLLPVSGTFSTMSSGSVFYTNQLGRLVNIEVIGDEAGDSYLKHAVSFDGGTNFKEFNNGVWVPSVSGMTTKELEEIREYDWHLPGAFTTVTGSLDFKQWYYVDVEVPSLYGYKINYIENTHLIPSGYCVCNSKLDAPVLISDNNHQVGHDASNMIDGSFTTYYGSESLTYPEMLENPVYIGFDFTDNPRRLSAIRVAPRVTSSPVQYLPAETEVWGSNIENPTLDDDTDWVYIDGFIMNSLSDELSWTHWTYFNPGPIRYRHIKFKFKDTYVIGTTGRTFYIAGMQVVDADSEKIIYGQTTGDFALDDSYSIDNFRIYVVNPTSDGTDLELNEIALLNSNVSISGVDISTDLLYNRPARANYKWRDSYTEYSVYPEISTHSLAMSHISGKILAAYKRTVSSGTMWDDRFDLYQYNLFEFNYTISGTNLFSSDETLCSIYNSTDNYFYVYDSGNALYSVDEANNSFTTISGESIPQGSYRADAVHDEVNNIMWLYRFTYPNELWAYHFTDNRWELIGNWDSGPAYRNEASISFDKNNYCLWLFGGRLDDEETGCTKYYDDLWKFHIYSRRWERITYESSSWPSARLTALTVDTLYNRLLVAGGKGSSNNCDSDTVLLDTWEFDIVNNVWNELSGFFLDVPVNPENYSSNVVQVFLADKKDYIFAGGYGRNVRLTQSAMPRGDGAVTHTLDYETPELTNGVINQGGIILPEQTSLFCIVDDLPLVDDIFFGEIKLYYDSNLGPPGEVLFNLKDYNNPTIECYTSESDKKIDCGLDKAFDYNPYTYYCSSDGFFFINPIYLGIYLRSPQVLRAIRFRYRETLYPEDKGSNNEWCYRALPDSFLVYGSNESRYSISITDEVEWELIKNQYRWTDDYSTGQINNISRSNPGTWTPWISIGGTKAYKNYMLKVTEIVDIFSVMSFTEMQLDLYSEVVDAGNFLDHRFFIDEPVGRLEVVVNNTNLQGEGPVRLYNVSLDPVPAPDYPWDVPNELNYLETAEVISTSGVGNFSYLYEELSASYLDILTDPTKEGSAPILPQSYINIQSNLGSSFHATSNELRLYTSTSGNLIPYFYTRTSTTGPWTEHIPTWSGSYYSYVFDTPETIRSVNISCINTASGLEYEKIAWAKQAMLIGYEDEIAYGSDATSSGVVDLPTNYANAIAVKIYNNCETGTFADARILPRYTGNYDLDCIPIVSEDKVSWTGIDSGIRLPEDIPLEAGRISEMLEFHNNRVRIQSGMVSGTWTSPVIEVLDPSSSSAYVYCDNESFSKGYVNRDYVSANTVLEVRSSDTKPMHSFMVFGLDTSPYNGVQVPWKVVAFNSDGNLCEWEKFSGTSNLNIGEQSSATDAPYRFWDYSRRRPLWQFYGAMDSRRRAGIPIGNINATNNPYMFYRVFPNDGTTYTTSDGQDEQQLMHWYNTPDYYYPIFSRTLRHTPRLQGSVYRPSWQLSDVVYRSFPFYELYQGQYYSEKKFHLRNLFAYEGESATPEEDLEIDYLYSFEGDYSNLQNDYIRCASCPDNKSGGVYYWFHYALNDIAENDQYYKTLLINGTTVEKEFNNIERSFNFMVEVGPTASRGFWGITENAVYLYEYDGSNMVERYALEDDGIDTFILLQHAAIDYDNNLWFIDLGTQTLYRVNYDNLCAGSDPFDYKRIIQGAVSVYPDPSDGSAYVYVIGDPEFPENDCVKIVHAGDYDHIEPEFVCVVPGPFLVEPSNIVLTGRSSAPYGYLDILPDDPVWGPGGTAEWEDYASGSPTLPQGKYKQLRIKLSKINSDAASPELRNIRIPIPALLNKIPYRDYKDVFIDTILHNYDLEAGDYEVDLLVWWPK